MPVFATRSPCSSSDQQRSNRSAASFDPLGLRDARIAPQARSGRRTVVDLLGVDQGSDG